MLGGIAIAAVVIWIVGDTAEGTPRSREQYAQAIDRLIAYVESKQFRGMSKRSSKRSESSITSSSSVSLTLLCRLGQCTNLR